MEGDADMGNGRSFKLVMMFMMLLLLTGFNQSSTASDARVISQSEARDRELGISNGSSQRLLDTIYPAGVRDLYGINIIDYNRSVNQAYVVRHVSQARIKAVRIPARDF